MTKAINKAVLSDWTIKATGVGICGFKGVSFKNVWSLKMTDITKTLDVKVGADGTKTIHNTNNNDILFTGKGKNIIFGEGMNHIVVMGDGDNTFYGGPYKASHSVIFGGAGKNTIYTEWGNDIIYSGKGTTTVHAGVGNNTIYGGCGKNTFVFDDRYFAVDAKGNPYTANPTVVAADSTAAKALLFKGTDTIYGGNSGHQTIELRGYKVTDWTVKITSGTYTTDAQHDITASGKTGISGTITDSHGSVIKFTGVEHINFEV
jgi:Ca2+-binding RTX toxin-like protein